MAALKLIPQLLAWGLCSLVLVRGFGGHRGTVRSAAAGGFVAGAAGGALLLRTLPADLLLGALKAALGGSFFLLWGVAVAALYRSTVRDLPTGWWLRCCASRPFAALASLLAGVAAGGAAVYRLPSFEAVLPQVLAPAALALAGLVLTMAAARAERRLPADLTAAGPALMAAVVALLLFSGAAILRVDLFAPLSMKVMKGVHDFVHQFMESILIPDHLFVRTEVWGYIGLLFSKDVGFWGGMVIWFTPPHLIALAIRLEPLPPVAHIRQGARRRLVLAAALRAQRWRLAVPALAVLALAGAAYRSLHPDVEYWDPKPLAVTAGPGGEIVIPKKGEADLEDGKLHKYLLRQGGKEARFFLVMTPEGTLTAVLDACAICKPDGYGQAEGSVVCYYCKTLIPLETVGKPGGCNPVPLPFTDKGDGVHIDAITLVNEWTRTVQATARVTGGGR